MNFHRSGFIEYVEIMDEEKGLLKFIRDTFLKAEAERPVPDLRKDRDGWYRRWDEDGSGELEFEEVVRAFAKSFHVDVEGIAGLRENLRDVWCVFAVELSIGRSSCFPMMVWLIRCWPPCTF